MFVLVWVYVREVEGREEERKREKGVKHSITECEIVAVTISFNQTMNVEHLNR